MALSQLSRQYLTNALANKARAKEIADAIDALHAVSQAGAIASLGVTTNLPATGAVLSTTDTYTDAAVKTAIDGAVTALRTPAEARLDAIEAKIDALLASLRASAILAT
jgi:hypothetical protein